MSATLEADIVFPPPEAVDDTDDVMASLLPGTGGRAPNDDSKLLHGWPRFRQICQELGEQYKMGGPLSLNFFFLYGLAIVTISFVGHIGAQDLAAAALAMAVINSSGRLLFMGLCGGTDTQASQAFGAGRYNLMPIIFQRTVLFLAAHVIPVTAVALVAPLVFERLGSDSALCHKMGRYTWTLLPGLWIEVFDRPMNRILVAQRITRPQMWISGAVLVLHIATNVALAYAPGYNYLYVGAASSAASFYYFFIQATYILMRGYGDRVFGTRLERRALLGWGAFARLAYPAAGMRCMESFCYTGMTIVAGLLPDPDVAVSAIGLAFNTYGVAFMAFMGVAVSCGTRVGNALGAGAPGAARLAAQTSISFVPVVWIPVGLLQTLPWTQDWLVRLFVDPDASPDVARVFGNLLYIVAALELLDGLQTVMGGVLTGAGKQMHGMIINFFSFYVVAAPLALLMAFDTPLQVNGLYIGLSLGPLMQCLLFIRLILGIDWPRESSAAFAFARASLNASCSLPHAI